MPKLTIPIRGMHCRSCEILVEERLRQVEGVTGVDVSHSAGRAKIRYAGREPSQGALSAAVEAAGYQLGQKDKLPWLSRDPRDYYRLAAAGLILAVLYFVAKASGLFNLSIGSSTGSLWVVPVVGLVAGFSSCMALIGGLVLGISARHAELHPEATAVQKFRPHLYFNAGRVLGYGLFGGVIGLAGSVFRPSPSVLGLMTLAVGVVMILLGLKLIEIFPALKDMTLTLPKAVSRLFGIRRENREYTHANAVTAGAATFFLPCGFTQAMQLYAVSTGSFVQGALIMGLFALGTAPGLLGIGGLSSLFRGVRAKIFFAGAGLAVILLGFSNIGNASRLVFASSGAPATGASSAGPTQEVRMTQGAGGYSPNEFTVTRGRTVRWIINSTSQYTCASTVVMPSYRISRSLKRGENIIEFTPNQTGTVSFSCSMGMYRGKFTVVDEAAGGSSAQQTQPVPQEQPAKNPTPAPAASGPVQKLAATYTARDDISPNTFTVKAGSPVRLEVDAQEDGYGCMSTIMIPGLYETPAFLEKGSPTVMEFTPAAPGQYPITCAMGVQRGVVIVQ